MTHKDIYTKFMIEYDKANVTSSYPSLTEYEVATVLDKAYQALISQKVTGNNVRRSTFESDIKSIADLGPLTKTKSENLQPALDVAPNVAKCTAPADMLYFLQATMNDKGDSASDYDRYDNIYNPIDKQTKRKLPVKLVNHEAAQKFFASAYNIPWVKNPVCYIEDRVIDVVYDPLSLPIIAGNTAELDIVYIRRPNSFVKDIENFKTSGDGYYITYFDYSHENDKNLSDQKIYGTSSDVLNDPQNMTYEQRYTFECNDTVAEELISLAVAFALENVESSRLNAKLNMRGLEA